MVGMLGKRTIAYILDFFVVSAFMWIISFLLFMFLNPYSAMTIYAYFPYVVPILIMIYFVGCEYKRGTTVGKALMFIEVRSFNGYPITFKQAFLRNLTKIYWFPIIFDLAIGKFTKHDDRILNELTKTVVIDEEGNY